MEIEDWRLRKLYEYWLDCRRGRRFPSRRDVDPTEIRFILGHVMLVDVLTDPLRFRVRLHGTEMAARAHYELTGKFLDELPLPEYRHYVIAQCNRLVASGEPLHVRHDRILDGQRRAYEALWLPFSDNDAVSMLGCGLVYEPLQPAPPHPSGLRA
jgi:hypothetical protein